MINLHIACAVKRRWSTAGESPARELGSLHPEAIGAAVEENEAVGASGVEGHLGDLASMQAVTRVVCLESLYQLAGESPVVVIAREPRSKLLMSPGNWGCESGVCLRGGGARWQSVP